MITWTKNQYKNTKSLVNKTISEDAMKRAYQFHKSIPEYTSTPLYSLPHLSNELGVKKISIKDEGERFGQQSFKVLGGSYAIASYLAEYFDLGQAENFSFIKENSRPKSLTFATATDGNHGRGLAWAAQQLKQQAVVYLPKGSSSVRLEAVQKLGAHAEIIDLNYDETVRYAMQKAEENDWIVAQDTAWEDYSKFPAWVMQGYLTIIAEVIEQINIDKPTHVVLQAGVGSFAGAMASMLKQVYSDDLKVLVVEPTRADCFYQSALQRDGQPHVASGDLTTMMAGLSCGEPNPIAWNILKDIVDGFVSCADDTAAKGMRLLGDPNEGDPKIIAGESGAVPVGLLYEMMKNDLHQELRDSVHLDENAHVLIINTEGATDPNNYNRIMMKSSS